MKDFKELISKMTLKEKACQLTQVNPQIAGANSLSDLTGLPENLSLTKEEIDELGSVLNLTDVKNLQDKHLKRSKHKIPLSFMMDVIHGCDTVYPIPLAMGCSFDEDLIERCAKMSAIEAKLYGLCATFSPMVDLARDARWGRVMETTGEDYYLNGRFGRAFIRGYHKGGIGACVKHFASYGNAKAGRDYNTTDMSEHTLKQYYLRSYEECMKENPELVMTSFNALNGVPMNAHSDVLVDILRNEWGFDGVVISDYSAIKEMNVHGFAEDEKECAMHALNNQIDIEMMSSTYIHFLPELVKEGKVKEELIDKMLERALIFKEKLGLMDEPYFKLDEKKSKEISLSKEHRDLARIASEKSCVLLKNEGILPLNVDTNIALIGPFADTKEIIGAWAGNGKVADAVSLREGVTNLLSKNVPFASGVSYALDSVDESNISSAVRVAESAEVIVACLGEHQSYSGEGRCRTDISVPAVQISLLKALKSLKKPIVSVVFGGRPQILNELEKYSDAILYVWQPGTEGGNAIARLLFGKVYPTGKLTMSFPRATGQCPIHYDELRTGRPRLPDVMENQYFVSSYLDCLNSPLYPFGYGLTYTDFEYSDCSIDNTKLKRGKEVTVSVKVKNTDNRAGETTAQLYINDEFAHPARPVKELKNYQKITLNPGEEKTISFKIDEEMLKFWTVNKRFEAENGTFKVWIYEDSTCANNPVRFELTD